MFEALTIRRLNEVDGLDFGLLAESLLFYDRVILTVNSAQLTSLVRVCGYETVRELFDMKVLSLTYLENGSGVRTLNTGTSNEIHDFVLYDVARLHLQNCLPDLLKDLIGREGKARRVAERLKRSIVSSSYSQSLNEEVLEDSQNSDYVSQAISRVVRHLAPEYPTPDPFIFEVTRSGANLRVRTNLDFSSLNEVYHQRVSPEHSTLTAAYLLRFLQDARSDLQIASAANSELAISQTNSIIVSTRIEDAIRKRLRSEENLSLFQESIFDDSRAIREAVNGRQRNMQDVVSLVASAKKFRHWVAGQPENTDLRKAYLSEVTKLGWAEKLPRKTVRWGLFTMTETVLPALAGPIIGTAGAIGLSALDTFVVDKLAQGWKPNQFVEGPLKEFLRPDGR